MALEILRRSHQSQMVNEPLEELMQLNRAVWGTLLVFSIAAPATWMGADQGTEQLRAAQIRQLEAHRKLLLAMADSMPEALYRDRATPVQRDFANQVLHILTAMHLIVGYWVFDEESSPLVVDTAAVLNSRVELTALIASEFGWAIEGARSQSEAMRNEEIEFFGGERMARWMVLDEVATHTMWTAGQIVANFRKHGMPPPAFGFF